MVGPGDSLTHVSLWQESPGPLTHLSCLRITHCLPELSDKSPILWAGSSHSKEARRLAYPPSSLTLGSASCTSGMLRGSVRSTPTSHSGALASKPTAQTSLLSLGQLAPHFSFLLPALYLSSFLPSPLPFPVLNSPIVANMLTRFPCSRPLQARTAHVLPSSWWLPAPLPCPRHERLNVQVSPRTGAVSMKFPCRERSSTSVLVICDPDKLSLGPKLGGTGSSFLPTALC